MALKSLLRGLLRRAATRVRIWTLEVEPGVAQRTLPKFANQPRNLVIDLPRRLIHPERMVFGDHVWLGPGCFLSAVTRYPSASLVHPERQQESRTFSPTIEIGHRVVSSGQLVVGALQQVTIEDDVLLSYNVTLLDNMHGYSNPDEPYKYQMPERIAPVLVKRGCWIGQNVVILPGVTIGEMSIVGANSVVTRSIPDRCIAAGNPARILKVWDDDVRQWRASENHDVADRKVAGRPMG